jgi:hypothetical protein
MVSTIAVDPGRSTAPRRVPRHLLPPDIRKLSIDPRYGDIGRRNCVGDWEWKPRPGRRGE